MKSLRQRWHDALHDWRYWVCWVVLLLVTAPAFARPSDEEKQYCAALSSFAHVVGINRANGVSKENAWPYLVQQQREQNVEIGTALEEPIRGLIEAFYKDDVVIGSAAELMFVIANVHEECLEQF